MTEYIKKLWCSWFHGGGKVTRDINDCINWQCSKCGRWAVAVTQKQEGAIIDRAIKETDRG